ncbi:MAG: serine/threonine-protein kinase PknK [Leptospiraceae bacterium]|nr:serine/threonine-protein kinase PknK [Leptospiraceae bacterium]
MITLQGYSIETELHRGDKSIVYRGEKSGKPVIVKYLNEEYPTQIELERFRKEFDFLQKISLPCIVKPIAFEKYKNSPILVFEDIQGKSLRELLKEKGQFPIPEFLEIAMLAVKALGELHSLGAVHKDIKPHNLIFNPGTKVLQIIDFGNATLLTRENPSIKTQNLEGTLSYISPEQTGRMNRSIDYRTDYYSLGVTFYQMLTGNLPFISKNPMELVYAHLAKKPIPPNDVLLTQGLNPGLVEQTEISGLSNIILKLLEKNPEDRYQSSNGILHDLKECLSRWETNGKIESFLLATKDQSSRFQIPEQLYGRKAESERLIQTFEKASRGSLALAVVSGISGIGKTALIQEVQKPIVEYKGRFISGKFDKFKRNIPYYALIQGFRNLVEQILTLDTLELEKYKIEILEIVGINGKVLTDIIPELELIIGEQPNATELPAMEGQNRLNLLFVNLIRIFCKEDHPLVLFLDDLQWADISSLNLLKTILTDSSLQSLFIILAYRSNEVDAIHPFAVILEEVKKTRLEITNISINPLSENDVNQLVADTLDSSEKSSSELSQIIHSKTGGNPFFVNSVFRSLYRDGVVYYYDSWKWEIAKVKQVAVSENVIEHTRSNISLLSSEKRDLLKLAACVGNWFLVSVFSRIINKSLAETEEILAQIANEGYLLLGGGEVRFAHDKIREATYTFMTEEEKSLNHYKIGTTFLSLCKEGLYDLDDFIFTIVNQLNQGILHVTGSNEQEMLLDLNLKAIDKAFASSAYESALILIRVGLTLLPAESWESKYDITLNIYTDLAKAEYLNGNNKEADACFETLLKYAKTNLEKASINEIKISYYTSLAKLKEALDTGIDTLAILGFPLPGASNESVGALIGEANSRLGERTIESLLELPITKNPIHLAALRLLSASIAPAFISNPAYFPILVLKMVNISLEFGNSEYAAFAYVLYGVILGSALGNYEVGQKFGELGVTLIERLNAKEMKSKTFFFFGGMVNHWKKPIKENKKYLTASFESGMNTGDFQYSSYSINYLLFQPFHARENLNLIEERSKDYYKKIVSLNQEDSQRAYELWEQLVLNLTGTHSDKFSLTGEKFDEEKDSNLWKETQNASCLYWYYQCKTILYYIFEDYEKAFEYSELALPCEGGSFGLTSTPEQYFFHSLSCLASKEPPLDKIRKNQERMKVWAENCPANYGHKYYIVEAELTRIAGNTDDALELYDKAISLAKEHQYLLEEAIANELAAKYWFAQKKEMFAKAHLTEAHYAYQKWGCKPKLATMEKTYPYLKN